MVLTRCHVKGECLHSVALWLSVCGDAATLCAVLDAPSADRRCLERSRREGDIQESQEKGVKSYFAWWKIFCSLISEII